MECILRICNENLHEVDHNLIVPLIRHCVSNISSENNNSNDLNLTYCKILVEIGAKYCTDVMDDLFIIFQPGTSSAFNVLVLNTLADLATKNPYGMVPYLKALLGSMLPMLSVVKQDHIKGVFAYTLMKFAESIQEYLANIEKAPDQNVTKEYFTLEFENAYNHLSMWLQIREPNVRGKIIEALGVTCALISFEKFQEILPQIITSLLSYYKRPALSISTSAFDVDLHSITKSLCLILELAIKEQLYPPLNIQIDNIISNLFNQICVLPDYSQPSSIRNHNEILRCFATLTIKYCDPIILFLLNKLDSSNESVKIGSLTILRHLINACDVQLVSKMPMIFSGLRIVLYDESIQVRKILTQVIVAVAYHGYLDLSGGESFIQFIIRQCSLPIQHRNSISDFNENSLESLVLMCENVLYLLVTTVNDIENVMWPHLFEYLLPKEYRLAAPVICRSLGSLLVKLHERANQNPNNDLRLNFQNNNIIPKPAILLARLFVLIGGLPNETKILPVLKLIKLILPLIDEKSSSIVCNKLDQLIDDIQSDYNGDFEKWQSEALCFVTQYLDQIIQSNHEFIHLFGKSLLNQIHLYNNHSFNKYFLLLILGDVIRKIATKQFSIESIEIVFSNCDHTSELEQNGCAHVAGQAASGFLDVVLVKLEQIVEHKKTNSLLNMIVDSVRSGPTKEQENVKSTVLLSYGKVAKNASSSLLLTRLETPILRSLISYYKSSKDLTVKFHFIQAVKLIAETVSSGSSSSNANEPYILRSRNELLNEITLILKTSSSSSHNQIKLCLETLSYLVNLEPILNDKTKQTVIIIASNSALSLQNNAEVLSSYKQFLKQIVFREKNDPFILESMIRTLNKWLISTDHFNRLNATESVNYLLKNYLDSIDDLSFKSFNSLGSLLGLLVPRCFDPDQHVCQQAFSCLIELCLISDKMQSRLSQNDHSISTITLLSTESNFDDPEILASSTNQLSKCIAQRFQVNDSQLILFIKSVFDGLMDPQTLSSTGSSLVLNELMKLKGSELKENIEYLVDEFEKKLSKLSYEQTRQITLKAFCSLAFHHLSSIIKVILTNHIHFDDTIKLMIKSLAQDDNINEFLLEFLLEIITENQLTEPHFDVSKRNHGISIVKPNLLAAICALKEVFLSIDKSKLTEFGRIFTLLLLAVGSYVNTEYVLPGNKQKQPNEKRSPRNSEDSIEIKMVPVKCAIETFQAFILSSKHNYILNHISSEQWIEMEFEHSFHEIVSLIGKLLCDHSSNHIPNIVNLLLKVKNSGEVRHRVVLVSMFSQVLVTRVTDESIDEIVLNTLFTLLEDESALVRRLCVVGFRKFIDDKEKPSSKFTLTLISAMLNEMDVQGGYDKDTALEAINCLASILNVIQCKDVKDQLVTIANRLRTQFDKVFICNYLHLFHFCRI